MIERAIILYEHESKAALRGELQLLVRLVDIPAWIEEEYAHYDGTTLMAELDCPYQPGTALAGRETLVTADSLKRGYPLGTVARVECRRLQETATIENCIAMGIWNSAEHISASRHYRAVVCAKKHWDACHKPGERWIDNLYCWFIWLEDGKT